MSFFHFQNNYKCLIKCISKKFTTTGSSHFLKKVSTWSSQLMVKIGVIFMPFSNHARIFLKSKGSDHLAHSWGGLSRFLGFQWDRQITNVGWSSRFLKCTWSNTCNFFDIFWKKLQRLDQVQTPTNNQHKNSILVHCLGDGFWDQVGLLFFFCFW